MTPPDAAATGWQARVLAFRTRHLCVEAGRGGVALDFQSGRYFALNQTAAFICARLLDTDPAAIVEQVGARFALDPAGAEAAITAVMTSAETATPGPAAPAEDFPYRRSDEGYTLFDGELPVIGVDTRAATVRLLADRSPRLAAAQALRLVSPKILQARGVDALHAAALERPGTGLVVFTGRSGAGKSTTTRLYAEISGARRIADDLVVLASDGRGPACRLGAEAEIYRWCDRAAAALLDAPDRTLPVEGLVAAAQAPAAALLPIAEVFVLARERRQGTAITTTRLDPADALGEILNVVFLGAADAAALGRFLGVCRDLVTALPVNLTTVPDGLPALRNALEAFARTRAPHSSKTTSMP